MSHLRDAQGIQAITRPDGDQKEEAGLGRGPHPQEKSRMKPELRSRLRMLPSWEKGQERPEP